MVVLEAYLPLTTAQAVVVEQGLLGQLEQQTHLVTAA